MSRDLMSVQFVMLRTCTTETANDVCGASSQYYFFLDLLIDQNVSYEINIIHRIGIKNNC